MINVPNNSWHIFEKREWNACLWQAHCWQGLIFIPAMWSDPLLTISILQFLGNIKTLQGYSLFQSGYGSEYVIALKRIIINYCYAKEDRTVSANTQINSRPATQMAAMPSSQLETKDTIRVKRIKMTALQSIRRGFDRWCLG